MYSSQIIMCVFVELIGEPNAETEVEESDDSGDENDELLKRGNVGSGPKPKGARVWSAPPPQETICRKMLPWRILSRNNA